MMDDVLERMLEFISEDVGEGDITSLSLYNEGSTASAVIKAKGSGVVAGLAEIKHLFEHFECSFEDNETDGNKINHGDVLARISGPLRSILLVERVSLNILGRMSGIATMVSEILDIARTKNPKIRIAATRKTTPGFRYFEKRAIVIGGGESHRHGLADGILIKENHLVGLDNDIEEAVRRAREG
ncbi:unnamed protein product, partial [marine sediment metagenome]